jgi:probable phosphoglycerate mutase
MDFPQVSNGILRLACDDAQVNVSAGAASARRLWLLRHGESTWNSLGLVQGQAEGSGLTPRGFLQADACARELAGAPVSALYSSDLERAARTAAPVASSLGLPVLLDARLRERALGIAEGAPTANLGPEHSGVVDGRVVDADAAPPGGESVRELYDRAVGCVERILVDHPAGDLVLVTHGGVVRVVLAWLEGSGPDGMGWPEIENGRPVGRVARVPTPAH